MAWLGATPNTPHGRTRDKSRLYDNDNAPNSGFGTNGIFAEGGLITRYGRTRDKSRLYDNDNAPNSRVGTNGVFAEGGLITLHGRTRDKSRLYGNKQKKHPHNHVRLCGCIKNSKRKISTNYSGRATMSFLVMARVPSLSIRMK
jgi:hypothetical protein